MKKVLMIAYAFPPVSYAGVFRPLRFVKNLPAHGWQPLVLTLKEYSDLENDRELLAQIPDIAKIYRTPTIDPVRLLWRWEKSRRKGDKSATPVDSNVKAVKKESPKRSFKQKIKRFLFALCSFPDHMIFWIPFAVIRGIIIVLREKPAVIYSTSPPHSAHLSALILSWLFSKPWIADFRDAWGDADNFSEQCFDSKRLQKVALWIENRIFKSADKVLMVTDTYRDTARKRYPDIDPEKFQTLTNGFDADDVQGVQPYEQDKFTVVYTGAFYAYRQPDLFLDGVKCWLERYRNETIEDRFQVLFVGSDSPELQQKIEQRGLQKIVRLEKFVPKAEAMRYNLGANLLLLIIGFNKGSEGILTSKIFDYFLCGKKILAIAPEGEAANLVRRSNSGFVVSDNNPDLVADILEREFNSSVNNSVEGSPIYEHVIGEFEASGLTRRLTGFLDQMT